MGVYMLLPAIAGMGATAGLAVIAVLICRGFLKKGPKLFCYLLWSVVLFRLLCPVSVPSTLSVLRLLDFERMDAASDPPATLSDVAAALKNLPPFIAQREQGKENNPQDGKLFSEAAGSGKFADNMDSFRFDAIFGDHFMGGGFYDLWVAWEGRLMTESHPSNKEEKAAAPAVFDILLPVPPMPFLEAGLFDEDRIAKKIAIAEKLAIAEKIAMENGIPMPENGMPTGDSRIAGNTAKPAWNGIPLWLAIATWVWVAGMTCMAIYAIISLFCLHRRLIGAVRLKENIYQSDYIASPFVVGVFAPKIYLPSALCGKEQEYILMHEKTHIRRGDHIFRLLAFSALVIHWFNPLVWLAFFLSGKDMEMACDEAVMRRMKEDIRAEYSASLLGLATGRHLIPGTYLAFGEGDVKSRIKNVMRYKKPTVFWMVFAAILVSGTVCAFGSDPKEQGEKAAQEEAAGKQEGEDGANADNGDGKYPNGTDGKNATDAEGEHTDNMDGKHPDNIDGSQGTSDNGSSAPKTQRSSFTVYSLTDSEIVRNLIADYASRCPEIEIHYETGEEGLSAMEKMDALSAKLAAGMGPDVLILDGLPAQSYQTKGLLSDLAPALEPLKEELQQNILSAYTKEDAVYMLPLCYIVPTILTDEEGEAAAKSLRDLMHYRQVYLQGYSRADLLELVYYHYMPEFIHADGSVDETELANFLLFTKWMGDDQKIAAGEGTHAYFEMDFDVAALAETNAELMFVPLRGEDDLYAYSEQVGEMLMEGKKIWSMDIFFPETLIGINAWSQKKELADEFVRAVFSYEMQSENTGFSGFPVNRRAFLQQLEEWQAQTSANGIQKVEKKAEKGDTTYMVDYAKLAEQMQQSLTGVSSGRIVDAAVLQILQEETKGYFDGEVSLWDCVAAIVERLP